MRDRKSTPVQYITSQTGDVIAITDADGEAIAQYAYDEWGKLLGIGTFDDNNPEQLAVAEANPLRYRGYYYDNETGYYYLQSRYYDPGICRFINADIYNIPKTQKNVKIGINLFDYCYNNPINTSDITGKGPVQSILGVIGDVISTVISIVDYIANSCNVSIKTLENKAETFTKAKKQTAAMKEVVEQSNNLSKKLGKIGSIVSGFALVVGVIEAIRSGAHWTYVVVKLVVDFICELISEGVSFICKKLSQLIPGVGFIVSIAVAAATSIALDHYFSDNKISAIANSVNSYIKNHSVKTVNALFTVVLKKITA